MDTVSTNPLLRTWVIVAPALILATWLGYLIGDNNYLVGVGVLAGSVALVLMFTLGQRGVLEPGILAFLIMGYVVGNRGFAEQAIVRPLFIGEAGLGALLLLGGSRCLLNREMPKFDHPLLWLVFAYLIYGGVRFLFDVREYQLQAARDLAIVYYSLFFFIAYQLGSKPFVRAFLEKAITVSFLLHAVIVIVLNTFPNLLFQHFVVNGAPLFFQKSDLTASFSAVGLLFVAARPRFLGTKSLRALILIILSVSVALSAARAALFGLAFGAIFFWLGGQRRFFIYPAFGLLFGALTFLFIIVSGSSVNELEQFVVLKEKLASMVDFTGNYRYQTDFGANKNDNNEFRKTFWTVMVQDTTESNPIFGKGFGYDFLPKFEAYYNRGGWEGLRSPHNYFITVYGRMGLIGLLIFGSLAISLLHSAWKSARQVRDHRLALADFSYWCGSVVLLASACVGVVLEGPMGAIPFWTLVGLALSSPIKNVPQRPAREAQSAQSRPISTKLSRPQARSRAALR